MECREHCGACCIALSISSSIPDMPHGKKAGTRCVNLLSDCRCAVYDIRPKVCREFTPSENWCGNTSEEALRLIAEIEKATG